MFITFQLPLQLNLTVYCSALYHISTQGIICRVYYPPPKEMFVVDTVFHCVVHACVRPSVHLPSLPPPLSPYIVLHTSSSSWWISLRSWYDCFYLEYLTMLAAINLCKQLFWLSNFYEIRNYSFSQSKYCRFDYWYNCLVK